MMTDVKTHSGSFELLSAARRLCVSLLGFALLMTALPMTAEAEDGRISTIVIGIEARRNVEPALAAALTDVLQGQLSQDPKRTVISRAELKKVLQFEEEKLAAGCTESCVAEIAMAMDADRVVSGSIDKVGSQYLIVVTEIDADNVETLARVQETIKGGEDDLIAAIEGISRQLMIRGATSSETTFKDATLDGAKAGSAVLLIRSEPSGAEIKYGDQVLGDTPLRIPGLSPGTQTFKITPPEGESFTADIDVGNGKTIVRMDLDVPDVVTPTEVEAYSDDLGTQNLIKWGSLGSGTVSLLLSPALAIGAALTFKDTEGFGLANILSEILAISSMAVCCVGVGLLGTGFFYAFTPPSPPMPGTGRVHLINIRMGNETVLKKVPIKTDDDGKSSWRQFPGGKQPTVMPVAY